MSEIKGIKEVYSQFFEEPTRKKLKEILDGSFGETDHMEFKSTWIEKSDLAKKILSIANSNGGAIMSRWEQIVPTHCPADCEKMHIFCII